MLRPSGNLIAAIQALPDKQRKVRFFERNGQYRHGFTIPTGCPNSLVKSIEWNVDSSILALVFACKDQQADDGQ